MRIKFIAVALLTVAPFAAGQAWAADGAIPPAPQGPYQSTTLPSQGAPDYGFPPLGYNPVRQAEPAGQKAGDAKAPQRVAPAPSHGGYGRAPYGYAPPMQRQQPPAKPQAPLAAEPKKQPAAEKKAEEKKADETKTANKGAASAPPWARAYGRGYGAPGWSPSRARSNYRFCVDLYRNEMRKRWSRNMHNPTWWTRQNCPPPQAFWGKPNSADNANTDSPGQQPPKQPPTTGPVTPVPAPWLRAYPTRQQGGNAQ